MAAPWQMGTGSNGMSMQSIRPTAGANTRSALNNTFGPSRSVNHEDLDDTVDEAIALADTAAGTGTPQSTTGGHKQRAANMKLKSASMSKSTRIVANTVELEFHQRAMARAKTREVCGIDEGEDGTTSSVEATAAAAATTARGAVSKPPAATAAVKRSSVTSRRSSNGSYPAPPVDPLVELLKDTIKPDFDVELLSPHTGAQPLLCLVMYFCNSFDLLGRLEISSDVMKSFVMEVEVTYRCLPYHSALHGADVLTTAMRLLKTSMRPITLSPMELLTLIIGCAGTLPALLHCASPSVCPTCMVNGSF